jgi:hypothetical protein
MKTKYKKRNKRKTKKGGNTIKNSEHYNKKSNFNNVILVVVFNYSNLVINKDNFKKMYKPYFKEIIFYSDLPVFNSDPEINYIYTNRGNNAHSIFPDISKKYKDLLDKSDGLFYTMDDNIINLNILNNFDKGKIIYTFPETIITDLNTVSGWAWDNREGKDSINRLLLDDKFKEYKLNEFIGSFSDYFYLPKKYLTDNLFNLFDLFSKYEVFLEISIPTIIYYSEKNVDNYEKFNSTILWGYDRNQTETHEGIGNIFNSNPLFVHPIKFSNNNNFEFLINNIFNRSRL